MNAPKPLTQPDTNGAERHASNGSPEQQIADLRASVKHLEQLAAVGRLTAAIVLEIKNPLALSKTFAEFFHTTGRSGEGSELGLAICKEIIKRQNGEILLSSREGIATEVRVRLPL